MTTSAVAAADVVIIEWDDLMLLKNVGKDDLGRGGDPNDDDNNYNNNNNNNHDIIIIQEAKKRIQDAIESSYGINGIGIMAIRGVPNFVVYKDQFLPQAYNLATQISESCRETYLTDPTSFYNSGWSYGKERLGNNKPPDISKGSYYYNPITDTPGTEQERLLYPSSFPSNKWPINTIAKDSSISSISSSSDDEVSLLLPNFQQNAKQIGILLKDVSIEVAKHLDVYVQEKIRFLQQNQQNNNETNNASNNDLPHHQKPLPMTTTTTATTANYISIYDNLKNTEKVKARLLYYYPIISENNNNSNNNKNEKDKNDTSTTTTYDSDDNKLNKTTTINNAEDSWIGWHNDSGFLTALAGDIYINHKTGERIQSCPDPNAGLYVIDRRNDDNDNNNNSNQKPKVQILKVNIPYDCCAIQIGECVQIITGGILCATPHCVRGCTNITYPNIARISLPCFIDTHPSFPLVPPMGISRQEVLMADSFSHNKVPPLALRWKTNTTIHNHNNNNNDHDDINKPMAFGEFLHETFQMYYGWGSES